MPLSEEDLKEIREKLGLTGDKTLAEMIAESAKETTNALINGFDKRLNKDAEKAEEARKAELAAITEKLEALGKSMGDNPPTTEDGEIDFSKLPKGIREKFTEQHQAMTKLQEQFEASEKARQEADAKAAAEAEARAVEDARSAIRNTLLSKDTVGVEYDPDGLDLYIDSLVGKVSKGDDGKYRFETGTDAITKDPTFADLGAHLKELSSGAVAKKFQRAAGGKPPKTPDGGTPPVEGEKLTLEQMASMKPSEIAEAAEKGLVDVSA